MAEEKLASDIVASLPTLLLFIAVTFLVQHCWKRRRFYYYGAKLPGTYSLPIVGSIHLFSGGRDAWAYKLTKFSHERELPLSKFWMASDLAVMVTDPDTIGFLMKKCLKKSSRYDYLKPEFREGLLTAPLDKWKIHRSTVNRTFKYNILCSYIPIFMKHTNRLIEELKKSQNTTINIFDKIMKSTFSVVHESCLGLDWSEGEEHARYMKALIRGGQIVCEQMLNPLMQVGIIWQLSPMRKELQKLVKIVWSHPAEVLKIKKVEFEKNKDDVLSQPCFMNNLLKITYEDGLWTDDELMDESQNMIAAGSDTTAITMSFFTLLLGLHPEIQEKIYQEVMSIFEDGHDEITVDDLLKMDYLDRALKEAMRLFPAAPFIMRNVDEDVTVGKYLIPKDTTLFVPIRAVHTDPRWWQEPQKFDPDRFLPEEVEKRPRNAFMPFSAGPRNCVGFKFAEMSMKVTAAMIIKNFKITTSQFKTVDDIKVQLNVLISSKYGYPVTLVPRNKL